MEWILVGIAVALGAFAINLWWPNAWLRRVVGLGVVPIPLTMAVWQYHAYTSIRQEDYSYVPWPYLWIVGPGLWLMITFVVVVAGLSLKFRAWLANSVGSWIHVGVPLKIWGPHNQPFWFLVCLTLISAILIIIQLIGSHTKAPPTLKDRGNQIVTAVKAAGNYADAMIMGAMGKAITSSPEKTVTPAPTVSAPEKKPYPFQGRWFAIAIVGVILSVISGMCVFWDDLKDYFRGALELLKIRKGEAVAVPAVSESPAEVMVRKHGAVTPITPAHELGWRYWIKHILANFAPDWFVNKFIHR